MVGWKRCGRVVKGWVQGWFAVSGSVFALLRVSPEFLYQSEGREEHPHLSCCTGNTARKLIACN